MTGLFTGIIGSLIGAGIQATLGGIPIREDASKALEVLRVGGLPVPPANWFSLKSSDEPRTERVYDKIGQHIPGAIQILGPCIAQALQNVAHPVSQATAASRAWASGEELARSTPFHKSAEVNDPAVLLLPGMMANIKKECDGKCSHSCKASSSTRSINSPIMKNCKPRQNFCLESIKQMETKDAKKTTANLRNSRPSNDFCKAQDTVNVRSKGNTNNGANSLVKGKMLRTVNANKGKTEPRERATKEDKLMITARISKDLKCQPSCHSSMVAKQSSISKTESKLFKPQNKSGKSDKSEICQICLAQIKKTKKPRLIPCGHIAVCYRCLNGQKLLKCPECGMKFN